MARFTRQLGANIYALMTQKGLNSESLAVQLGLSNRDMHRTIEGKLLLPPHKIEKIAGCLNVSTETLISNNFSYDVPDLEYMKEFKDQDNLDKILDIIDTILS